MMLRSSLLGLSLALFGIACGGSVASSVLDPEPSSKVDVGDPPPAASSTGLPVLPPVPATTTAASLKSACEAARTNLVDGNRANAVQHFSNNGELAIALPGKWYACSKSPLFAAAGVAFHEDGTSATLVFDGKDVTENGVANPWSVDLTPPAGYEGTTFLTGDIRFWTVMSLDGKQAIMGKPELGSSEWIYVRVD